MEHGQCEALLQIKQEPLEIMDTEEEARCDGIVECDIANDYDTDLVVKEEPTDVLAMHGLVAVGEVALQDVMPNGVSLPLVAEIKEERIECEQNISNSFQVVNEYENMITVHAADYEDMIAVKVAEFAETAVELLEPACNIETFAKRGRPRKVTCPICSRRFQNAKLFSDHRVLHSFNFVFCSYKNCNQHFDTLEDCELHEYHFHKSRQLKCNVCSHKFLKFEALIEHKNKMHDKLKRLVCSVCREWFINEAELHEHWQALPQMCGLLLKMRENVNNGDDLADKGVYALRHVKIPIQKLRIRKRVDMRDITKGSTATTPYQTETDNFEFQQTQKRACLAQPMQTTTISESQQLLESLKTKKRAPQLQAHASLPKKTSMCYVKVPQNAQNTKETTITPRQNNAATEQSPVVFIKSEPLDDECTNDAYETNHQIDTAATALPLTEQTPVTFIKAEPLDDIESAQSTSALTITEETPVICIKEEPLEDVCTNQVYAYGPTDKGGSVTAVGVETSMAYIKQELGDEHAAAIPINALTPVVFINQEPADDFSNAQQTFNAAQNIPLVYIKEEKQTSDDDSNTFEKVNRNKAAQSQCNIFKIPSGISTEQLKTAAIIPIEPLSSVLARRITSNFLLKTVPKVSVMTIERPPTTATAAAAPPAAVVGKAAAPKMLKLSPHMKIVKFAPEAEPRLTNVVPSTGLLQTKLPNGNATSVVDDGANANNAHGTGGSIDVQTGLKIEFTTAKGQKLFGNRHFTLKKIELPNTDEVKIVSEAVKEEVITVDAADDEKASECDVASAQRIPGTDEVYTRFDIEQELKDSREVYGYEAKQSEVTDTKSAAVDVSLESLTCQKCYRQCSSRAMMKEHINSNCGRSPQHECVVCHKRFFSASTLNCHRTIHTGELPHKCSYCEKRFRTRGQVTVHHRTHTGERPFVCEVCMQGFTHRETLISHLSRHIGMKRYKCYGCDKQFSCISGLSMHRANRPYTCGKVRLNTRAIGPRVRVIKGQVMFEPQPEINPHLRTADPEVLTEIQNK